MFEGSFKCGARKFQGSFSCVSRTVEGCSEKYLKVIQGNLKKVQSLFQGSFKDVQGSFKKVSGLFYESFQGSFKNVSFKFCFAILLLHGTHHSYPNRRRACSYYQPSFRHWKYIFMFRWVFYG